MVDCTDPDNFQVTGCCTTSNFDQCTNTFTGQSCSCVLQDDGRIECGWVEDGFFYSCPARCCEKGKGCQGECYDNPPEATTSSGATTASSQPSTSNTTTTTTSCPTGCVKADDPNKHFLLRKGMLIFYAILMGIPLIVWFSDAPMGLKIFMTLMIIVGLSLYIPLVLLQT